VVGTEDGAQCRLPSCEQKNLNYAFWVLFLGSHVMPPGAAAACVHIGTVNMTERVRVLILLAVVVIIGSVGTSLISYVVSRNQIQQGISDQELPLTGDNIYSEIQRDLLRPVFISSLMAQDTFVRDWLIAGEDGTERIVRYLREVKSRYKTVTAFLISGRSFQYYHAEGMRRPVDEKNPLDSWFFRVRDMIAPYEINVDADESNRNTMTVFINHRVMDYNEKFLAIAGVGLTLDTVAGVLDSYQERFQRQVYFVDSNGKVVLTGHKSKLEYDSLDTNPGLAALIDQVLVQEARPVNLRYQGNGHEVLLNSRYIGELGWYLIVEQHLGDELQPLQRVLRLNLLISALVTALVLGIALFTVNRYQRKLEKLATVDALTSLPNRQAFNMLLTQVMRDEARTQQPLSALLIDIDHFKTANDNLGHLAGDRILATTAGLLREPLRDSDIVARWGGEEFVVLLRDCSLGQAEKIAESLRVSIESHNFFLAAPFPVTISVGVAQHVPDEPAQSFFARMDKAMYQAKAAGRNQIKLADPEPVSVADSVLIANDE
jgi:diguanylate cyclase (GGDEF)-like protein